MNHSIKKALLVLLISAGLAGQVQGSTVSAVQVKNAGAAQMFLRSARALGEFVGASVQKHITPVRIAGVLLAVSCGWLAGTYFASKHWSTFTSGLNRLKNDEVLTLDKKTTAHAAQGGGAAKLNDDVNSLPEAPLAAGVVNFMTLTGQSFSVECGDYTSLEQLKGYLAELLECSSEEIHILFAGRKVETSDAFRDFNQEHYHVIVRKNRGSESVVQRAYIFENSSVQENLQLTTDKLNTLKKLAIDCEKIEVELLFGENQNVSHIVESSKDLLDEIIAQNSTFTYDELYNALADRLAQLEVIKNETVQVDNELDND